MDAARRAIADKDDLRIASAGVQLTIEYVATGSPGGTICWHIAIEDGHVELVEGRADRFDLRLTAAYDTAVRIARGELGAQRAFVEGRLRVGGDLSLLIRHHKALATVDDALAGVRSETTYA
jgi:putative sterol carrier protein